MKVYPLTIICLLHVGSVFGLKCFDCYEENDRSCDASRKRMSCYGNSKQCYSLIYYNVLNKGVEEHGFKKGCVDERLGNCQSVCQHYLNLGYKDCKVYCCDGDLCNENGFHDLADQSKKTKRSSIGSSGTGGVTNSASHYHSKLTLFIHILLFITLYLCLT